MYNGQIEYYKNRLPKESKNKRNKKRKEGNILVHTMEMAYNTLIRPTLEYCSSIWDPCTEDNKSKIE